MLIMTIAVTAMVAMLLAIHTRPASSESSPQTNHRSAPVLGAYNAEASRNSARDMSQSSVPVSHSRNIAALLTLSTFQAQVLKVDDARLVRVTWKTESEISTAGFNVHRGDTPYGPFHQINSHVIPASGEMFTGARYQFDDAEAVAGPTFYYQLEEVELDGTSVRSPSIPVDATTGP